MIDIRTGQGYDLHRFGPGDHVMLGGVRIPHDHGFVAHSDGDVVLHALTDAVLGALALGDIGDHFPPSDPKWRDASSAQFLVFAVDQCHKAGFRLSNLDVTIIAEAPKIDPHRDVIRQEIAQICSLDQNRIAVKATTHESIGSIGRQEGMAALALATIIGENND